LKALSGSVDFHPSTVFGHFGQTNINHLNQNNTIIEEIQSVNNKISESVIRNICGIMMFSGDNAKKKISLLSGGEKSRVMLGK
ncbi:ABC transporter ATP-binding protein, partial [Aliarcobacter butzleri]